MIRRFLYPVTTILSLLLIVSCSTDDDDNPITSAAQIQQLTNAAETGTWRVTSMIDSGVDETSDFNGYDFTFASNGTVTATNGTTDYNGTWSVTDDSSDDDNDDDSDVDFNLFFTVNDTNDFDDLNDDWDLVSYSDTIINLTDVDDSTGEIDVLRFERN